MSNNIRNGRKMVRSRALTLTVAALTVGLLSSCSSDPAYTLEQLKSVSSADDAPANFELSETIDDRGGADLYQEQVGLYRAGGGTANCEEWFAAQAMAIKLDFENGEQGLIHEIARYTPLDDFPVFDLPRVLGRLFEDEETAEVFMNAVRKAAEACPGGYATIEAAYGGLSAPALAADSVDVTSVAEMPEVDQYFAVVETTSDQDYAQSYRWIFVRSGNAVLATIAGINAGHTIDYSPIDIIAFATTQRLLDSK